MYKVFVIDDEPAVVQGLCEQIDWESYNLEVAGCKTDSRDVFRELEEKQVHLLITDICMPGMDGLELITRAKA
jgi:Response regulator containing CheY-like receiver domain and AraC-type DNA-binding domain